MRMVFKRSLLQRLLFLSCCAIVGILFYFDNTDRGVKDNLTIDTAVQASNTASTGQRIDSKTEHNRTSAISKNEAIVISSGTFPYPKGNLTDEDINTLRNAGMDNEEISLLIQFGIPHEDVMRAAEEYKEDMLKKGSKTPVSAEPAVQKEPLEGKSLLPDWFKD